MSKRSVDKRDRDKKTEGQSNSGAKPQDAKPVHTAKAGRAEIWLNTDLYWYAGLLFAVLLSFY
ncbi:MAG: hypothetical protein QUS09_10770, partial [Methanotrichaceae archaeon]|nr:hypothetical protein [Methanotrichaceae archaeon]